MPATEVTRRAGHSVAVLLNVDAYCIDGQSGTVNKCIAHASAARMKPATDGVQWEVDALHARG